MGPHVGGMYDVECNTIRAIAARLDREYAMGEIRIAAYLDGYDAMTKAFRARGIRVNTVLREMKP
jgi:hypothetical protein